MPPPVTVTPPQLNQSGASTPNVSIVPDNPSTIVPPAVKDYLHSRTARPSRRVLIVGWQKYYDDALASEESTSPTAMILGGPTTTTAGQQGWNIVGGKTSNKSSNPRGIQNRTPPSFART
jgi:hypothetical protein